MDLMESYECHTCVPGGTSAVNLNLHAGGFHLYPHIHGTGGGEFLNGPSYYSVCKVPYAIRLSGFSGELKYLLS